ncbi:MAG: hypothetical protein LBM64_04705 [Deltaproteobacteria bacterium]|jgi:hypothetical protein|nr:hypothetical protein [Deltaproteobacteria bacterium]
MRKQVAECSPEFQEFLRQVETALIKSSAEARRLAEQTGTKLIIRETFELEKCDDLAGNSSTARRDVEHQPVK